MSLNVFACLFFFFLWYLNLKKRSNASIFPPQIGHPITKNTTTFLSKNPCVPCLEQWENLIPYHTGSTWPTPSHTSSPMRFLLSLFSPFCKSFKHKDRNEETNLKMSGEQGGRVGLTGFWARHMLAHGSHYRAVCSEQTTTPRRWKCESGSHWSWNTENFPSVSQLQKHLC